MTDFEKRVIELLEEIVANQKRYAPPEIRNREMMWEYQQQELAAGRNPFGPPISLAKIYAE